MILCGYNNYVISVIFRTLKHTALRETFEEIGIPGPAIDIWAKGPEIRRPDLVITPFLGYVGELAEDDLDTNSDEVVHSFNSGFAHIQLLMTHA